MRVNINQIRDMKLKGEKIAMLTAYDYSTARIVDEAGIPLILVGDSLGMVVLGYESTIPVTMEDMLHHTKAVVRGTKNAMVVGDMPFMTYTISIEEALRNAGRFIQEAGAQAVKLEGGLTVAATVRRIVDCGIPVMGHIGLTPQSVHAMGGHRVQGRGQTARKRLLADATALEAAGCYAIVLEAIPEELAAEVTQLLKIPTIGIGAGAGCDGQILVIYDLLGLDPHGHKPKFVKKFATLGEQALAALTQYREDVRTAAFPGAEHVYHDPTAKPAAKAAET